MASLLDYFGGDLPPELLKLFQTEPADKKAPLNAGLMAAGLGMLANAQRGAAGGIGAGGLLGLNAYNEERQRQQKDPMQQIQMLSALQGLQQGALKNQWMKDVTGGGAAMPQYAPQSDFAPGEAPGPVTAASPMPARTVAASPSATSKTNSVPRSSIPQDPRSCIFPV